MNWKLIVGSLMLFSLFVILFASSAVTNGFWPTLLAYLVLFGLVILVVGGAFLFAKGLVEYLDKKKKK